MVLHCAMMICQVSPLELAFVETSDPLATSVSADTLEVGVPSLLMEFENVPVDRIDEVQSGAVLIIMPLNTPAAGYPQAGRHPGEHRGGRARAVRPGEDHQLHRPGGDRHDDDDDDDDDDYD